MVPLGGNDPPAFALSRRCSTTELQGHINTCMISDIEAIALLQELAKTLGPYNDRLRSTCKKTFTPAFPQKSIEDFERDNTLDGSAGEI